MPQWIACQVWMFSDIICLKAIGKHNNGLHHVDHVFLLLLFNHKYYSHQWLHCFDFAATICLQHRCWLHTSTPLSSHHPACPPRHAFPIDSPVFGDTPMAWKHRWCSDRWWLLCISFQVLPGRAIQLYPFWYHHFLFHILFQDAPSLIQFFVFIMLLCATCCDLINRPQFDSLIFLSYASNYQRCCCDPTWYIGQHLQFSTPTSPSINSLNDLLVK